MAWVAEFIRLYTTRNNRWLSPKFLIGESYGTTRAAALSEHLLGDQGIALNGIVFISTVLNFATLSPSDGTTCRTPCICQRTLPRQRFIRSCLRTSRPISATLKEVEKWALGDYVAALAKEVH